MPDLEIVIGGRSFRVTCQPGEEHFLSSAAALLDAEAQPFVLQGARMPEARLLLMSGLMLADKMAAVEDENRRLREALEAANAGPAAPLAAPPPPPPQAVAAELPEGLQQRLAGWADQAEALARQLEGQG